MPLEEYARKRNFSDTPEPPPSPRGKKSKPTAKGPYFCVQRHDATRLHYDFRLEVDAVLKSWAIPKGPTLDPTPKHLAAHVEDHPLDYGDFEGNIPAGNYGAGSVMLWDRGAWELLDASVPAEQQLERGDFKFRLHGEKLNGDFALVRMKNRGKGNEWLIIKKRDEFALPGWNAEDYAWSVLSGRSQEEIAQGMPAREGKRKTAGDPERVWKSRPARGATAGAAAHAPVPAPAPPKKKRRTLTPGNLKGARKAPLPASVDPMKATLVDHPPTGDDWLFEVKWDGVRALCFIDGEDLRIDSRTGRSQERQYPELSVLPHYLAARQAILDGEIAVLDEKGVSRFELIQPRIANTEPAAVARLVRSNPAVLFVFDLLYLDGYDLRGVALADRRRALEAVVTPGPVLRISEHFEGDGEDVLEAVREAGLEGIVAKCTTSTYEPRRSRQWLKLKVVQQQEFLICGFTAGERDHFGALVLGVYQDGKLVWAGNVGTGFTGSTLQELRARLDPLVTSKSPFTAGGPPGRGVTWVRPELVAMVKFSNWTQDNRLRAPVYLGLRQDVRPAEVHRETPHRPPETRGPLLRGKAEEATLNVDGRSLKFTNLNKVLFPEDGYTKRDLIQYYDAVAGILLPHLKDRPLSLKRYPNGIHEQYFFQKDVPQNWAPWLRTVKIWSEHNEGPINYVFAEDRASLLYLANLACIDQNPWMSRVDSIDNPDFVLIDLDPQDCPYDRIVEAALLVRTVLESVGLEGYPKTTGGDGMHVYIPVEPVYTYEDTRNFAELLSRLVIRERPELFTTPRTVSRRQKGKVYFDYLQNGKSKTIAAPYVPRAYPHAPVSTPLAWREVKKGLLPTKFTMKNAPARFARTGDLFEGVLKKPQVLEDALNRLERLIQTAASSA